MHEIQKIREISDDLMRNGILEVLLEQSIMPVKNIMIKDVARLDHTQTAYDAAMLMIKKGVGYVVITAYDKPFGMITERDIVCAVAGLNIPIRNLILSFLASRPLIYAKPYQTIEAAADIMRKYNIRRLPVLDGDKIVGIVTTRDLAMFLSPT